MRASANQFKIIRSGNPFLLLLLIPFVLVLLAFFALIMLGTVLSGGLRRLGSKGRPAVSPELANSKLKPNSVAAKTPAIEAEFHHIPN